MCLTCAIVPTVCASLPATTSSNGASEAPSRPLLATSCFCCIILCLVAVFNASWLSTQDLFSVVRMQNACSRIADVLSTRQQLPAPLTFALQHRYALLPVADIKDELMKPPTGVDVEDDDFRCGRVCDGGRCSRRRDLLPCALDALL